MSTTLVAVLLAGAGVACVLVVSWVFYRIGKAEDRERAEAEAAAAAREEPERAANGHRSPGLTRERRRPRPPRRPG